MMLSRPSRSVDLRVVGVPDTTDEAVRELERAHEDNRVAGKLPAHQRLFVAGVQFGVNA